MRHYFAVAALAALVAAPIAAADKSDAPHPPPPVFQAVLDCKALTEAAARLACYDRSIEALAAANRNHEVVIADRATVREAKRGLFGLRLPRLKLFGGDGDEEVTEITGTLTAVRAAPDGMPIFVLDDGARWKQTEGRNQFAKSGDKIRIHRGSMGSFIANLNEAPGVRVVRLAN